MLTIRTNEGVNIERLKGGNVQCRLTICTAVTPIHITQKLDGRHWLYKGAVSGSIITWRKTLLSVREAESLTKADGFDDFDAMLAWFEETYGFPFKGFLIEWKLYR